MFLRHAVLKEAVHSTAMEHAADCECTTCRAANGDEDAWATIYRESYTPDDE